MKGNIFGTPEISQTSNVIRFKTTVVLIKGEKKLLFIAGYNFDILHTSINLLIIFNGRTVVETTSGSVLTDS
jgi:hypothetical protein